MGIVIGYCGTDIREINMWSVQKNHFRIMFISHTYIDNHGKKNSSKFGLWNVCYFFFLLLLPNMIKYQTEQMFSVD